MAPISDKWKWKYFWRNGWTGQISLMRLTKIAFGRAGFSRTKGGTESIDDRKSIKTDLPDRQRGLVMPGPDPAIHPNRKLLASMDVRAFASLKALRPRRRGQVRARRDNNTPAC
jgi:hypothetical protein